MKGTQDVGSFSACVWQPDKHVMYKTGDYVEKQGGDYRFAGVVVAAFQKLSGVDRFVVKDDRGVLHIYSAKNLKITRGAP